MDAIRAQWPGATLIVTVDNGIVAHEAIAYAGEQGFDVIVTDHHEASQTLPEAIAVVDPKRDDERYPFREFCGTGVAFKVMLNLYAKMGVMPTRVLNTLDLVALATVADVMPLVGENRTTVREGVRLIQSGRRPFFRALMAEGKIQNVTAHFTLGFLFGPAVNALCRMGKDLRVATQAMICPDEARCREAAAFMLEVNAERKAET